MLSLAVNIIVNKLSLSLAINCTFNFESDLLNVTLGLMRDFFFFGMTYGICIYRSVLFENNWKSVTVNLYYQLLITTNKKRTK